MSTETEQVIRYAQQRTQLPQVDPTSQTLRWNIGKPDLLEPLGIATAVASTPTYSHIIEPPTTIDEWDLTYAAVIDTAHVDGSDNVSFIYQDINALRAIPLQRSQMLLMSASLVGILAGATVATWPNRDTSTSSVRVSVPDHPYPVTVRLDDSGNPSLRFAVFYEPTGTVGSRQLHTIIAMRRRRRAT